MHNRENVSSGTLTIHNLWNVKFGWFITSISQNVILTTTLIGYYYAKSGSSLFRSNLTRVWACMGSILVIFYDSNYHFYIFINKFPVRICDNTYNMDKFHILLSEIDEFHDLKWLKFTIWEIFFSSNGTLRNHKTWIEGPWDAPRRF